MGFVIRDVDVWKHGGNPKPLAPGSFLCVHTSRPAVSRPGGYSDPTSKGGIAFESFWTVSFSLMTRFVIPRTFSANLFPHAASGIYLENEAWGELPSICLLA